MQKLCFQYNAKLCFKKRGEKMYVIISPAKQLNFTDVVDDLATTQPLFHSETANIIKHLQTLSVDDVKKLMGISDALAQLNFDRFQRFEHNMQFNSKPALFAFVGDTYKGLKAQSFSAEDVDYAQTHLGILSGLYGVLRPLDSMQPYRLEMGSKQFMQQDLYSYWKPSVTKYLNNIKDEVLVNLASKEYSSVIDFSKLKKLLVNVTFLQERQGVLKNIGLMSKRARGMMAAFIIKNKLHSVEDLLNFEEDGYEYDLESSAENNLVFIKRG